MAQAAAHSVPALLERGWHTALSQLIERAQNQILIAAPFITTDGSRLVTEAATRAFCTEGQLTLLTDLSPNHVCDGSLDPVALSSLCAMCPSCWLWHIPRLHAKVYIADEKIAIITSGNLTASALYRNLEYGVEIQDPKLIRSIVGHFSLFQMAGTIVSPEELARYTIAAQELRAEFARVQRSASTTAKRAFRQAMQNAEDDLVRLKLNGGALHTVFAKTIEYVLRKHGPLSTVQIHAYIKELHPDLCDDSVDRIIDGQHFGKKWKHAVRTAQQMLKRRQAIRFARGIWQSEAETI